MNNQNQYCIGDTHYEERVGILRELYPPTYDRLAWVGSTGVWLANRVTRYIWIYDEVLATRVMFS